MNKKEIFNKIGTIVTEIHEQYDYLSEHPDNLNELELELFLANAKFLTGHIEVFQKLNQSPSVEKLSPRQETQTEKAPAPATESPANEAPEAEAPISDTLKTEEPVTKIFLDADPIEDHDEEPEDEDPEDESESAQIPEPEAQHPAQPAMAEPIVQEVIIAEKTISLPEETQSKPVKEPEHVPTVNDLMSAHIKQSTVGTQFTSQPVKDLKSIISLNDKLLFIKDLFNGYSLAYSEAIELLNRFDTFEAADSFLKNNYSVKNNWATKQSTVDHFYEILNRRFGS